MYVMQDAQAIHASIEFITIVQMVQATKFTNSAISSSTENLPNIFFHTDMLRKKSNFVNKNFLKIIVKIRLYVL